MKTIISDSVKYIGVDDKELDLFESQYIIPNGVSYNSYIIMDEKVAVMDTVDSRKSEEWMKNLDTALNGRTPDYLIVSHLEPDHSGSIADFAAKYPQTKLVMTVKAASMLPQFADFPADMVITVKEGEKLSLGSHTLRFITAPMVHWPEVMLEYEESEKILFSADAFGKFGALDTDEDWTCEARRYYFNIAGKYGGPVQTLLKKTAPLEIITICPLHGPILNENIPYYFDKYNTWSSYEPEDKGIFIAYASMHGNTKAVAQKFKEMLESKGAQKVAITDLSRDDMAEAVEDAFRYDRLVLAAASYDGGLFPPMEHFLNHLKEKAYQNRTIGIIENGSWAPVAAKTMLSMISGMKNVNVVEPTVTIKTKMKDSDIDSLNALCDALI